MAQLTTIGRTAIFTCESQAEAETIRLAVDRFGRYLRGIGEDERNWAAPSVEGPGFGWDAVRRVARDMHAGSTSYMSRRMAKALCDALHHAAGEPSGINDALTAAARTLRARLSPSLV
ncbi:hypothetical protein [Streptomyces sp. NRRL S-455]|uniref:hypothetical protein n=1 Tax=Streptomyces sp. NRRL S-455 TaxID=1463908 RepID=UPI0004C0525B|nr:hypothetical protein [Streptomyces sp. NRRL S-455]